MLEGNRKERRAGLYFCGEFLLNRVNEKYDDSKAVVKKTVYILVGVSGILTILSQLI